MFSFTRGKCCALTILTFPTSLCDIHGGILSQPTGKLFPLELRENVVRTWTKALESLVAKLMLREVGDAFLCSGELFLGASVSAGHIRTLLTGNSSNQTNLKE